MRAAFRTLVALTLLAWGQLALATDYYWVNDNGSTQYSSALAACQNDHTPYQLTDYRVTYQSDSRFQCLGTLGSNTNYYAGDVTRYGNACPSGTTYNASTGECVGTANCSTTVGKQITSALACTYNTSLKTYVCDDQITYQGCVYTGAGKKTCVTDLATGKPTCTGEFFGSGESAGTSPDTCTTDSCTTPADPGTTDLRIPR